MHSISTSTPSVWRAPQLSLRFWPVFLRNLLVWKKLAVASVIGNVAEPLITLVAFGYGLGALVGQVDGLPYIEYLASGSIAVSAALLCGCETVHDAMVHPQVGAFLRRTLLEEMDAAPAARGWREPSDA